jgi:hypothetical protein
MRAAVVAALELGVRRTELQRACGISGTQLGRWEEEADERRSDPDGGAEARGARVFAVVDETHDAGRAPAPTEQPEALELRLGPWSVSIRLAGQS